MQTERQAGNFLRHPASESPDRPRYHLRADLGRVRVPGHRARCVQPQGGGMEPVAAPALFVPLRVPLGAHVAGLRQFPDHLRCLHCIRRRSSRNGFLASIKNPQAREAIAKRLVRLEAGMLDDTRSLGGGINELKIQHGPGYRLYHTVRHAANRSSCYFAAATKAVNRGIFSAPESSRRRLMMKTTRIDPADHPTSAQVQAELISEAFLTGDRTFIAHAPGTVARARGMTGDRAEIRRIP